MGEHLGLGDYTKIKVNYMKNLHKNQPSFATFRKLFPFSVALWLYCHWASITRLVSALLDVVCLLLGLMACLGLLLIGGAL